MVGDHVETYAREWRGLRHQLGMTQVRFAAVLNLHPRTIQNVEGQRHRPTYSSRIAFDRLKARTYPEAIHQAGLQGEIAHVERTDAMLVVVVDTEHVLGPASGKFRASRQYATFP